MANLLGKGACEVVAYCPQIRGLYGTSSSPRRDHILIHARILFRRCTCRNVSFKLLSCLHLYYADTARCFRFTLTIGMAIMIWLAWESARYSVGPAIYPHELNSFNFMGALRTSYLVIYICVVCSFRNETDSVIWKYDKNAERVTDSQDESCSESYT